MAKESPKFIHFIQLSYLVSFNSGKISRSVFIFYDIDIWGEHSVQLFCRIFSNLILLLMSNISLFGLCTSGLKTIEGISYCFQCIVHDLSHLRPCKYRVILQTLHSLVLASIDDSCLNLLLRWLPSGNFSVSIIPSTFILSLERYCKEEVSLPAIFVWCFVCLLVWLYQCEFMDSDFIQQVAVFDVLILVLTLSPIWLVEPLQPGSCVLFTCPHHSLSTFYTSWYSNRF